MSKPIEDLPGYKEAIAANIERAAKLYWAEMLQPPLAASGTPQEALEYLGTKYVQDIKENPTAQIELLSWYIDRDRGGF